MKMDTQALKAFIAVVEAGSFSAAADSLHLTQPAVTKRIQGLESQLGTPLFDRFQRRIVLTEAGRLLLPHAQAALQQLGRAELEIQNLSGKVGGPRSEERRVGKSVDLGGRRSVKRKRE